MPRAIPDGEPRQEFTVALHFFQLLTDYTSRHGLAGERLLELAGLPVHVAKGDENGRVAFDVFNRLFEVAASELGEPSLGLKIGQRVRPGHLGTHGYALMNCSTALELAQQSSRYSALTIDACHNVIIKRGNEYVRVVHSNLPGGALVGRLVDELQHSIAATFGRWITNHEDLNPLWASFRHEHPGDISVYEEVFRCPLRFGAEETAIAMDSRFADLPLPLADPQVRRVMEDMCAQLVKQLGKALEPSWLASARRNALGAFQQGVPTLDVIAQSVGLSDHEFKDLLSARGISFRAFLDDLRRALSTAYMQDQGLSLVDIAYLSGFSEQSAFQRAFKRWTGMTPGDYRRQLGS